MFAKLQSHMAQDLGVLKVLLKNELVDFLVVQMRLDYLVFFLTNL